KPLSTATKPTVESTTSSVHTKVPERPATPPAAAPETVALLDFENCLEQIWEQLIATPPTRGRSMTTVKIGRARILMSSWEVTAFVNEDGIGFRLRGFFRRLRSFCRRFRRGGRGHRLRCGSRRSRG